jgi:hypothetical protein
MKKSKNRNYSDTQCNHSLCSENESSVQGMYYREKKFSLDIWPLLCDLFFLDFVLR